MKAQIEPQLASFLNYLRVEKGLAKNTVEAYGRDLRKFAAFLHRKERPLAQVGVLDLREFILSLDRSGLESRSIARQVVSLRQFFLHLLSLVIIDDRVAKLERHAVIAIDDFAIKLSDSAHSLRP